MILDLSLEDFKDKLPRPVLEISKKLSENSFRVYLVGGSLRDILMSKEPHDFDIATNATPDQLVKIFPNSLEVGAKFGTVIVLSSRLGLSDLTEQEQEFQITTFRKDFGNIKGRWPSKVEFSTTIEEDLSRRDFTINSIAIDLNEVFTYAGFTKVSEMLVDPFNGVLDIQRNIIRAVGDPHKRMQEDNLRAIRACRFACTLGFQIETETFAAVKSISNSISQISMERVRDEFIKIIQSETPSIGIELLRRSNILEIFIPELLEGVEMEQNKYHTYDVYTHLLRTCDIAPMQIRIAALFHDIGKPRTKVGEHFYGHEEIGAKITKEILERLKFPKSEVLNISKLIKLHMFNYNSSWTDAAVRRFLQKVEDDETLKSLFLLRIADSLSNPKSEYDIKELNEIEKRIQKIEEEDNAIHIKDLAIDGNDLLSLGVEKSPLVGKILSALLEKVIEEPGLNNKEVLLKLAKIYKNKNI